MYIQELFHVLFPGTLIPRISCSLFLLAALDVSGTLVGLAEAHRPPAAASVGEGPDVMHLMRKA